MKLAEALILRSDLQKRLQSVQGRLTKSTLVQEGDTPNEDPESLLVDLYAINQELHDLILRIHRTNAYAKTSDGRSLLSLLNEKDRYTSLHKVLIQVLETASPADYMRHSRSEIKWVSTISVTTLRQQTDEIATRIRELNVQIQELNWSVDLA